MHLEQTNRLSAGRILSKFMSNSSSNAVEEVGLYSINSYTTKIPSGTDEMPGSHTWLDSSLSSGMIPDSVSFLTAAIIVVGSGSSVTGVAASENSGH